MNIENNMFRIWISLGVFISESENNGPVLAFLSSPFHHLLAMKLGQAPAQQIAKGESEKQQKTEKQQAEKVYC